MRMRRRRVMMMKEHWWGEGELLGASRSKKLGMRVVAIGRKRARMG